MARVVVLGASYLQVPLIRKCIENDHETHVISSEEKPDLPSAVSYHNCDLRQLDSLLELCRSLNPEAVVSIASDLTALACAFVNSNLDLAGEPFQRIRSICNKAECKSILHAKGFIHIAQELDIDSAKNFVSSGESVVIKPTDRSGSRGVRIISNEDQLLTAIDQAESNSFENKYIIEEYLDGPEFSVESISVDGHHSILAITKKYLFPDSVVEFTHVQGPFYAAKTYDEIVDFSINLLDVLNIKNCIGHIEIKQTREGIKLIEIGPRMGGDFIGSDITQLATGRDFCQELLDLHLGKKPAESFNNYHMPAHTAGVTYSLNPGHDEKLAQEISQNNLEIVRHEVFNPDQASEIQSSSDRYSYFIWKSTDNKFDVDSIYQWI